MNKKTVLILEANDYSPKAIRLYHRLGTVYIFSGLSRAQRKQVLLRTNILVVRLGYKVDAFWFRKMPELELVVTNTTGLNHIDMSEAKRRGIDVISLRGRTGFLRHITSTAEEAFGLILALVRKIPWAFEDVKQSKWNRDAWRGRQLKSLTLGILGFGRLGRIVARYARCFGMMVIATDPNFSKEQMRRQGARKVTMQKLFKQSDVVSVHVSLDRMTKNLVQRTHFRSMKPTAYFINTARGEIIDEEALLEVLKNKWIAGAALDVMTNETSDGKHLRRNPLVTYAQQHANLLIVPHLGGATIDAMRLTEEYVAQQVLKNFHYGKR